MGSTLSGCGLGKEEPDQMNKDVISEEDNGKQGTETKGSGSEADNLTIIDATSAVVLEDSKTVVGNLDQYQVEASFDPEAFPKGSNVSISLAKSEDFDAPDKERFELGDVGYDFTLEGASYVRPSGPVQITFKLDEAMLAALEDEGFFQIAYLFDGEWYLQDVNEMDMEQGTASITLYHFSWLFPAKLTKNELREQTAQALAEEKFNNENNLKKIADDGKSDLEKVISQATGVKDAKALEAVAEYMLNDKDFTSLMLSGNKADYTGFSTKVAEMMAKKMNAAAKIGGNATLIAGAFQAVGYAWELDAKGAAESISNALLDSSPYGKLLKLSIKVTDESIKSWKKNGIEEMYQAYKNGAQEGWFGYNVQKENFGEVLEQSAAIERQVAIDAVKRYCDIYGEKEEDLSASKLAEIKRDAITGLEEKFADRLEKEAEIAENKDYYKQLLDAFEKNNVDDSVERKIDLMAELTYEQRLESYERVTNKILDMVGNKKIEFDGLVDDSEIPIHVITTAIKMWYEEDGEKKVKEHLREQGYLPKLDINELVGAWSGTMTITEVTFDEAILEVLKAELPEESDDGCDAATLAEGMESMEQMEGTSQPFSTTISTKTNTSVSMVSDDEVIGDFTYNPDTSTLTMISGTSGQEDFNSSMTFYVNDATSMSGRGSMLSKASDDAEVTIKEGLVKISFTMSMTKGY